MEFKRKLKKFKTAEEKRTKTGASLRNYCYWLLNRRDYSEQELRSKMLVYALDPNEIEVVLNELKELKYVDDERTANALLRSELTKTVGPNKIKMKFKSRSVDYEQVNEMVKDVDWLKRTYEAKVKKFGAEVETDRKLQAKQIRYLQGRGFNLDDIFKAIKITEDELDS